MQHVSVKVTPGAKREQVVEGNNGALRISVKEKPERGGANTRVRELVAARLGVKAGAVRIVKGARTPNKVILIS